MGDLLYLRIVAVVWTAWLVSWMVAARWRARPAAEAPRANWRGPFALVAVGFVVMSIGRPGRGMLWTVTPALGWAMVALTVVSFAFAWWARITMGTMWSGGVMRTEHHRVIERGPFAWVRHPIYTSLIAASIAIAVLRATPQALAGPALVALGFYLKARVEERFLTEELTGYPEYRARVPMLVPLLRLRAAG